MVTVSTPNTAVLDYLAHDNFTAAMAESIGIKRQLGGELPGELLCSIATKAAKQEKDQWQDPAFNSSYFYFLFAAGAKGLQAATDEHILRPSDKAFHVVRHLVYLHETRSSGRNPTVPIPGELLDQIATIADSYLSRGNNEDAAAALESIAIIRQPNSTSLA